MPWADVPELAVLAPIAASWLAKPRADAVGLGSLLRLLLHLLHLLLCLLQLLLCLLQLISEKLCVRCRLKHLHLQCLGVQEKLCALVSCPLVCASLRLQQGFHTSQGLRRVLQVSLDGSVFM